MPVGTQGTMKGLTSEQVEDLGCQIILGNTYHLGHRPGPEVLSSMGGLHKFMNWNRNLLTDSGGFQMVSLLKLAHVSEEGVVFSSPHDGSEMVLTPEHSMGLQNIIGADIMMALDDVVSTVTEGPRIEEAMHRTIRWIDRCIAAHKRPREQNLFGILQGHLDPKLRRECITAMLSKDLPGYAIGGLSGGESKDEFWRIVDLCTDLLPTSKPRYLMGVGFAVDMIVSVALGVDMFDCVYPTRTARFGTALVRKGGTLSMKNAMNQFDMGPIEEECGCQVCTKYSRAFFYTLTKTDDQLLGQLLSQHNIAYQMRLMKDARNAIIDGKYPVWVVESLKQAGITLKYK